MTTPAYNVGDMRRLAANFQVDLVDTDPTAVTFTMEEPDGVSTSYTYGVGGQLVKQDTGDYYVDWLIAQSGRHVWRIVGTGVATGEESGEFYAKRREAGG